MEDLYAVDREQFEFRQFVQLCCAFVPNWVVLTFAHKHPSPFTALRIDGWMEKVTKAQNLYSLAVCVQQWHNSNK